MEALRARTLCHFRYSVAVRCFAAEISLPETVRQKSDDLIDDEQWILVVSDHLQIALPKDLIRLGWRLYGEQHIASARTLCHFRYSVAVRCFAAEISLPETVRQIILVCCDLKLMY
ncbi:hypothetical protein GUJ93_ZPchr0012g20845 [Zizania palustris]|uniref:Uncharacterized protein n=1 Tax=Zizania palustris TaxID=103762 RepID=A0A8J5WUE5_ZIZPA|nr:hypothetical protein GUJ93_ZPchr0012g20845 [Zizania palustris]